MVIGFYSGHGSSKFAHLSKPRGLSKVLIQMWVASFKTTDEGDIYSELTTQNEPFYILSDEDGGLASYRIHSLAHTIAVRLDEEDDDINEVEGQKPEGVISRVFRNTKPEISTNISHYSLDEYPHRDFALRCGIRALLCVPFFKTEQWSFPLEPDGVLEYASTCDYQLDDFRELCRNYDAFFFRKIRMYLPKDLIYGYTNYIRSDVEMQPFLSAACQTFSLPLAQCWVIKDATAGALGVVHQESNYDAQNFIPWYRFKRACYYMGLNIDEGPVGKSFISHKSYLCRNITECSITNYPLAHYASDCGSIACFAICLCSYTPRYREYVLEFFLPSQEMNSNYPQALLNSLLETMKEHPPFYIVASGEQLGEVLSVEVLKSSTHDEPEYYKIGQTQSSLPHHEGLENEGDESQQLPRSLHLLFKDGTLEDGHFQDIEKSNSTINIHEETATGETSNRTPDNVAELLHVDELKEESPVRCIEPQCQNSQPERFEEIIEAEGNTVEMDHSALEMTLEETAKHKEHTVAAERGNTVDKSVEDLPVEDVAYAMSDEDVSYALSKEEDMNLESISKHFGRPLNDAAMSFGVSRSTFKRICRGLGIKRWRSGKRKRSNNISFKLGEGFNDGKSNRRNFSYSAMAPVHDTVVGHASQDSSKMTVKATYVNATIRFELPDFSGIAELEENVIERLHLERKSFSIKYQDEEGDWILIACDKDVRKCMEITRSLKKTTMKLLIDLPINRSAF